MYRWCVHACDGVSVCLTVWIWSIDFGHIVCRIVREVWERDKERPPHSIIESIRHTQQTPLSYTQFDCITNQMRIFVLVNFPECAFDAVCNASAFYSCPISVSSTSLCIEKRMRFEATNALTSENKTLGKWIRWRRLSVWLFKRMRNWFTRWWKLKLWIELIKCTFNMVFRRKLHWKCVKRVYFLMSTRHEFWEPLTHATN